jgi:hypothetical protein
VPQSLLVATTAAALALTGAGAALAHGSDIGPNSSESPYLLPTVRGADSTALLTVGDAADNGYRMVGIPDGMGAFSNRDGTYTLVMNHELGADRGTVRAHGSTGAFVSKWTLDRRGRVLTGEDLIQRVYEGDAATGDFAPVTATFNRFCSADLPAVSAFYGGRAGTRERIFMNGEEAGAEGRAVANVVTGPDAGSSYILPWLGKASWENVVAMPGWKRKTVVAGLDDSGGGQVYFYVGKKQRTGNDVEKAGLTNGAVYGLKIDGVTAESDATTTPAPVGFSLVEIPGAGSMTGAELQAASDALGVTALARPEDGAWDPQDPENFYFATTASFSGISHLWHLTFSDTSDVLEGGTAEIVAASPAYDPALPSAAQEGPRMMDNVTVNSKGQVLVQEDPGGQEYLSGVFRYDPKNGRTERVFQHSASVFSPGSPGFVTFDEESSGIFPVPFLGKNRYLAVTQVHAALEDPELVEGGQLQLLTLPVGSRGR